MSNAEFKKVRMMEVVVCHCGEVVRVWKCDDFALRWTDEGYEILSIIVDGKKIDVLTVVDGWGYDIIALP